MSIQAVADFTNQLAEDTSLQQEFYSVVGNKEGMNACQSVAELGAKHGYSFSAEEAQQLREVVTSSQSGELSDEQLEAVAGGGLFGSIGGALGGLIGNAAGGRPGQQAGSGVGGAVGNVLDTVFSIPW